MACKTCIEKGRSETLDYVQIVEYAKTESKRQNVAYVVYKEGKKWIASKLSCAIANRKPVTEVIHVHNNTAT